MAQTLLFLQEQGVSEYEPLVEKAAETSTTFNQLSGQIREAEEKLKANAALQKHIINYSKTRNTYIAYRKAGYSKKFKLEHDADIAMHQEAKENFNKLALKKIPKVAALREEYAATLLEKKRLYKTYYEVKEESKKYQNAKYIVDRFLKTFEEQDKQKHEITRT